MHPEPISAPDARQPAPISFGLVYFLAAPEVGRVKIGFTDQIDCGRLAALNLASPVPLTPIAYMRGRHSVERAVHNRLVAWRRHGEWFEHHHPTVEAFIREFATPWPAQGEPTVSIKVPGELAGTLIKAIRMAAHFWHPKPRGRTPIDWSAHLPDVTAWAAMVCGAMEHRCSDVKSITRKQKDS